MTSTYKNMFTSYLHNIDYELYHEVIQYDGIDVAKVIGFKDGTYGYILDRDMSCSRGYKTVADCKEILFTTLAHDIIR